MNSQSICIIIFFFLSFCSLYKSCNSNVKKVLKIKQSFNTTHHLSSWDPDTNCCCWYGIDCDPVNNRVNDLHLVSADLSGQILTEVADLPYIETLIFHKIANLTGNIPSSIVKLSKLTNLIISSTNVSGPIPSFLSQLKNLTFLDLSFNNFSGPIPSSLSQLRNLNGLRLDRNKLTGNIPKSFGNLTPSLQYLYLSHNQFTGTIPRGWGDLNFTFIELQRNKLEGDKSLLLGKNKTIIYLDLDLGLRLYFIIVEDYAIQVLPSR